MRPSPLIIPSTPSLMAAPAARSPFSWEKFFKRFLLISVFLLIMGGLAVGIAMIVMNVPATALSAPIVAAVLAQTPISAAVALMTSLGVSQLAAWLKRLFYNAFPEASSRWFFASLRSKREGTADSWMGWRYFPSLFGHVLRERDGPKKQNALMVAIESGAGKVIIEFLLGREASLGFETDTEGNTPLHYAVEHNFPDAIALIKTCPLPKHNMLAPGSVNLAKETPLTLCVKKGSTDVLVALAGAFSWKALRINYQDPDGETALMQAVRRADSNMVGILVGEKEADALRIKPNQYALPPADPLLQNLKGETAQQIALKQLQAFKNKGVNYIKQKRDLTEIIQQLQRAEEKYTQHDKNGETLLLGFVPVMLPSQVAQQKAIGAIKERSLSCGNLNGIRRPNSPFCH